MNKAILILFFIFCMPAESKNNLTEELLDRNTGRGFYRLTTTQTYSLGERCVNEDNDYESYKKKANLVCQKLGFQLIDFGSTSYNEGCNVDYFYQCHITILSEEDKREQKELKILELERAKYERDLEPQRLLERKKRLEAKVLSEETIKKEKAKKINSIVQPAKDKCLLLGFDKDSPKFRSCVLELTR